MYRFNLCYAPDASGGDSKAVETAKTEPKVEAKAEAKVETPDPTAAELAELRAYKLKVEADRKIAEEAAMKARGEHEKLAEGYKTEAEAAKAELKQLREREKARIKAVEAESEALLKSLSPEIRETISEISDPDKRLAHARKHASAGGGFPVGTMAGSGSKPNGIPAEHLDAVTKGAADYSMEPAAFWDKIYKPRLDRANAGKAQ